jgi:hypothetical protein
MTLIRASITWGVTELMREGDTIKYLLMSQGAKRFTISLKEIEAVARLYQRNLGLNGITF